jgi:effector-binding domain-containing protein
MEEVYAWLRTAGIAPAGPKVVLYRDARESSLLDSEESCPIEAGVEVSGAFAGGARVVASATPEGRTAAAVHRGTYAGLPETHAAIRRWCGEAGVEIAGLCWEVYGDWSDDPERLRTEVFYLVKPT